MARRRLTADLARELDQAARVTAEAELARVRAERDGYRKRYQAALAQIDRERERADSITALSSIRGKKTRPPARKKPARGAATVIALWSDWHCEELVDGATVGRRADGRYVNEYNLAVCRRRVAELTTRFATLLEHERRLVKIDRVVVWLGGDFISGAIHPDTADLAQLAPLEALRFAGERIREALDQVATMADEVLVVTNSGNHGRNTPDLRIGTEAANSLETHLYLAMAAAERNPRITWHVGKSYLNTIDLLEDYPVRFQHGHAIRGGGVGGITIPINKALAMWDKLRPAALTCGGHHHQFSWIRAARYIGNGSLIGYNAYATLNRLPWEAPSQTFVVVDHDRRDVTRAYPIFVDGDLTKPARSSA